MSVRAGLRLLSRRTADSVKRLSSAHSQCEIAQLMRSGPPPSPADVSGSASSMSSSPAVMRVRHFVSSSSSDSDGVRSERRTKGGGKASRAAATAAAGDVEDAETSGGADVANLHDAEINSFIKLRCVIDSMLESPSQSPPFS